MKSQVGARLTTRDTIQKVTVYFGTFVSIEAEGEEAVAGAGEVLNLACEALDRVHCRMHPTDPRSDLAAIATGPAGAPICVHPWTFQVLTLAHQFWGASGGLFDPCLPEQPGRLDDIALVAPDRVIRRASVALDLGGIAKGFAVDRAIDALQAAGYTAGIVNAGGDLRVFGNEPRTIELHTAGAPPEQLVLTNEALAVSEPKSPRSPRGHRGFYSPVNGQYLAGRTAAVLAHSGALADALTKCAIVCPPGTLQRLLKDYGARLLQRSRLPT